MPLLLHITDTHIYSEAEQTLKGINTRQSFAAVTAAARAQFPDPDAVVLGGDLAQDESEAAYKIVARQFIDWPAPVHAITGNHDDQELMERILNPTIRFTPDLGVLSLGSWRVLLLNTQQKGSIGGEVSTALFRAVKEAVAAAEDKHVLLVTHHHPYPIDSHWLDMIGLSNGEMLTDLVLHHANIRGLLFGHVHQPFEDELRQARIIGTPSTCIQFAPNSDDFQLDGVSPGYRWLQLNDDGSIETGVERIEGYIPPDLSDNSTY